MLSRARPSRLCRGCRQDLQLLLERGFCGPTVSLRTRELPLQWRQKSKSRQLRYFTRAAITSQQPYRDDGALQRDKPAFQADGSASSAEPLEDQIEALQDLEKALGRPIAEAIQEDRAFGQEADQDLDGELPPEYTVQLAHGTIDILADLRRSGASQEDVVREARQTYGDRLPDNALNEIELKIYKRLYGDPISPTYEEFLDEEEASEVLAEGESRLYNQDGEVVDYEEHVDPEGTLEDDGGIPEPSQAVHGNIGFADGGEMTPTLLSSPAERALAVARALDGEILEDYAPEESEEEQADSKVHPYTRLGKFATNPGTILLSQENFVRPVNKIMSGFSNKHLKEMCEKTFGGPGLPDSPLTPRSGRTRPQVPIPLDASHHHMGEMEANAFLTTMMPPTYAAIMSVLVETRKRLGTTWLNNLFAKEGGPRVLDVGAGGAGVLAWREVVQAHWDAMHDSDRDPPSPPTSKSVVLTGSDALRHRAAALLENTTFIPRLPDYVHTRDTPTLEDDRPAQSRKQFDVIIATHSLLGLNEEWMRKQHVQNLWSMLSPEGGVLILIEKGVPRGFEAVAGARELLLERHIAVPDGRTTKYSAGHNVDELHTAEPGMIVAPCTNHEKCPMYHTPGVSKGRKDYCSFQQRYTRPNYLQRILGAKDRNFDDVDFSYISVIRGKDLRTRQVESWQQLTDGLSAPTHPDPQLLGEDYETWLQLCQKGFDGIDPDTKMTESTSFADGKARTSLPAPWNLPRLVFSPMKRRGHIIMDVCTPAGTIERWTVPKSFGKQAYRDARKSRWGDLWALGAKSRIPRTLKLGGPDTKEANRARSRSDRIKAQAEDLMEKMEQEKLEEAEEEREIERMFDDDLDDLPVGGRIRPVARKSKSRPQAETSRVETFTFDDVDESQIEPVLRRKGRATASGSAPASKPAEQRTVSRPRPVEQEKKVEPEAKVEDDDENDDLTAEELATLREWEAELSSPETNIKTKGAKTMRTYSKFAPPGQKGRARKAGRIPRAERPAGSRGL
ncbi:hypothetical protein PV11_06383 [Exophiala sideris]|uniref:37S ribosomal protein S22 n=1 Tax=Exophiala sideris TaxID=1016849 RepID=A0A0D1YV78_9EURO|nr:hypothetical protein PV11_06383 [Exophiala sideris]